MKINASTTQEYIDQLPPERKQALLNLRKVIAENLPEGFEETISYGMIGFVVPHSVYPRGYHSDPRQPLPFINLASQKNHIAIYHMGLYSDPGLLEWFTKEHARRSNSKLDMGKSCIRFKDPEKIPFELIGELARKMKPGEWVKLYEQQRK